MKNRFQGVGNRLQKKSKTFLLSLPEPKACNLAPASRGFSLIEMIVSVALFSIVMLISVSALLALVDANRKARALQSVLNNLNIALDGIVRSIRMGTSYHCGSVSITSPADCTSGGTVIAFEPYGGSSSVATDQWLYSYDSTSKRLYKSEDGGAHSFAVTSPEITIDDMKFYVVGTNPGDTIQPKIVIVIKGTAGADRVKTRTTFSIQATAVQRALDI